VVHCEAGCDRTGVVIAVVLGLLGVPDDVISADYDRTQEALPAMNARWRLRQPDCTDAVWGSRKAAMERTIATVRARWGDWAGWAGAHGLDEPGVARLRAALVDA
jgi:protein-tyrosine phosphatase